MEKKNEITNTSKKKAQPDVKKSTVKKNGTKKEKKRSFRLSKKIIFGLLGIFLIIVSGIVVLFNNNEKVVITIDNIEYTESDFNMYAYLIKYDYFGVNGTNLSEKTLSTQVSNDNEQTIGEYLKEKTISKIKVSAAILRIANENNITLNQDDLKEIDAEKEDFIEILGGKSSFKKMLKDNHTNDKAYDEIAKIDKLYDIIYNSLYKEGKRNDLTIEEIDNYKNSYKDDYVKIKQIILLKKDLDTNQYLDEVILNQKEELANSLLKQVENDVDFDKLVEKYSEAKNEIVESEYYLKNELVEELRNVVTKLNVGETSNVVNTDYAYHIVVREELDDAKLEDYLNSKREDKLIEDITDNLEKIAIIKTDYLEEIIVK